MYGDLLALVEVDSLFSWSLHETTTISESQPQIVSILELGGGTCASSSAFAAMVQNGSVLVLGSFGILTFFNVNNYGLDGCLYVGAVSGVGLDIVLGANR